MPAPSLNPLHTFPRPHGPTEAGRAYWLGLLGFFLVSFLLNYHPHDFPFFYHVDEAYKAQQVAERQRGFTHPLLLLNLTQMVHDVWGGGDSRQIAAEAGRLVSATAGAGSVTIAFAIGWLLAGALGGYLSGLALLFCPQLYLLSHFTKEDSVLTLGWLTVMAMLYLLHRQHGKIDLIATGMACGLLISSKYIGILLLPAALLVALEGTWPASLTRFRRLAILIFFAAGTFVVANAPLLLQASTSLDRLTDEFRHLAQGHGGISPYESPSYYGEAFYAQNGFWWIPAAALGWIITIRQKAFRFPTLVILGAGLVYLFLLLISHKQAETYYLPLNAMVHTYAGIGIALTARALLKNRHRSWMALPVACLLAVPPLAADARLLSEHWRLFATDSLAALREYVAVALPAEAKILQDRRVQLPTPDGDRKAWVPEGRPWPEIVQARYAGEWGTLEELRAEGFTHVAVAWADYYRFVLEGAKPAEALREEYEALRQFYLTLPEEAQLVWESAPADNMYFWPGLQLFDIRPAKDSREPAAPES